MVGVDTIACGSTVGYVSLNNLENGGLSTKSNIFVFGVYISGQKAFAQSTNHIYESTDGALTWTRQSTPIVNTSIVKFYSNNSTSVLFYNKTIGFNYDGTWLYNTFTDDNVLSCFVDTNKILYSLSIIGLKIDGISLVYLKNCIIYSIFKIGQYYIAGGSAPRNENFMNYIDGLWYSTDGTTWTNITTINNIIKSIHGSGVYGIAGGENGIWYSNGGVEWTKSDAIGNFNTVFMSDPYAIAIDDLNYLWYSSSYGVSWTQSTQQTTVRSIFMVGQKAVAASESGLLYSSNGGQTWTLQNVSRINSVSMSGTTILAGGNGIYSNLSITSFIVTINGNTITSPSGNLISVGYSVTSLTIAVDQNATISSITGNTLSVGTNTVTFTVTSQDETFTQNYSVTVNRVAASSVKTVRVNGSIVSNGATINVDLIKSTISTDPASVTNVNISPVNSNASISNVVGNTLVDGNNTVTFTVTAEDASTENYSITVIRSSVSSLKTVTINGSVVTNGSTINVANSVNSVTIVTVDSNATISNVVGNTLVNGNNTVTFTVTAEDASTENYSITVIRASASSVKTVRINGSVVSNGATINVVHSVNSVSIATVHSNASISNVVGNTLADGNNTVTFTVTAEDASTQNYSITVIRASASSLKTVTVNGSVVSNGATINVAHSANSVTIATVDSYASISNVVGNTLVDGNNTVTFTVMAEDESTEDYSITVIRASTGIVCFKEGSRILTDQGYRLIEELRPGDLVKTELNDYKPIVMMGKKEIYHLADETRIKDQLYQCSPQQYPELTEELIITGCHCILVDDLTDEQRTKSIEVNGKIYITGNKYRLPACVDERTSVYDKKGNYTIYHIALENEHYYKNYGIYANGLLVETCSKRYLKELSHMELLE